MAHRERHRYFTLRGHVNLHTRRLSLLVLGTLLGAWMVASATVPTESGRVSFRPFDPVANDPAASDPAATAQPSVELMTTQEQSTILPSPQALLYDDGRFTSEPGLDVPTLQAWLDQQPGQLNAALLTVGDRNMSLAEVVAGQAYLYSLNPKLLLALLEYQQHLVSNPTPDPEQLDWAMGFQGEDEKWKGLYGQIRWTARELRRGVRDFSAITELVYRDDEDGEEVRGPLPPGLNAASYAVLRVLARTRTPDEVARLLDDGSFVATYTELFEDPRAPLGPLPGPAAPFLTSPLPKPTYVTSFFDHEYPFLVQNGSLVSWWGRRETEISYDGHDGWDYGLRPPDPILAAAPGTVVWAGNSDDGCGTPARGVVLDHHNGYRTLYWHLSEISVSLGQQVATGEQLGIVGATGCAVGPHLHFQTQYLGRDTDPYGWCGSEADPWASHVVGIASRWLWADRLNPCALPADVIAVHPGEPGFSTEGEPWESVPVGAGGPTWWTVSQTPPLTDTDDITMTELLNPGPTPTPTAPPKSPARAMWRPTIPTLGRYRVMTYIPYYFNGHSDANAVKYTIHSADGDRDVTINQFVYANEWVDLGTWTFTAGQMGWVELSNVTITGDEGVWAGTVVWLPE